MIVVSHYRILDAEESAGLVNEKREFAMEVLVGLSERPKRLSAKYFYDDAGSKIFEEIMSLYEYYPTPCEREIFEVHKAGILAPLIERPFNLVDLGAGDGDKTLVLIRHLLDAGADFRYVPIDISEDAMRRMTDAIAAEYPTLKLEGIVADYFDGIRWLGAQDDSRANLTLFLGSNIGNFDKGNARGFLRRLWNSMSAGDHLLVGFDLKKDINTLLRAYSDDQGVTARFNLNLLTRMNRELGANFDVDKFQHFGTYDVTSGAMKSYLISLEKQSVYIDELQCTFEFDPFEPIFTEYSYKYLSTDIDELADVTGFAEVERFYDQRRFFCDALWRVEKSGR